MLALAAVVWLAPQAPAGAQPLPTAAEIERQHRAGDAAGAQRRLQAALQQRPGDAPLRFLQAVLAAEAGRADEAATLLERMTQEFPDLPEPHNNLAVLRAAAGRIDEARRLLDTALRLDPAYRTAHRNLADVYLRLAQRSYEAAAGTDPPDATLDARLQALRQLQGRPGTAR